MATSTPDLIRTVAAHGAISISEHGLARSLVEAECALNRELVSRIGESDDPDLTSFAEIVELLRNTPLGSYSSLMSFEAECEAWCARILAPLPLSDVPPASVGPTGTPHPVGPPTT